MALPQVLQALADTTAGDGLPVAALQLAAVGVPVFPCVPGGKRPATSRGFLDATTDPSRVARWWGQAPHANIGVPTGAVSGVVVVDVDVHAVDGYAAYRQSVEAGLVPEPAAVVSTPTGGRHMYFPADPAREQRSWAVGRAGVDFRGNGGYVIAPPSIIPTDGSLVSYRVEHITTGTTGPVDAARLRDFLTPTTTLAPRISSSPTPELGRQRSVERLASWVSHQVEGERNVSLFWAACRLAENGVPAAQARDVLVAAARQPGFGEREITRTVYSAYRAAATQTCTSRRGLVSSQGLVADGPSRRGPHQRSAGVRGLA